MHLLVGLGNPGPKYEGNRHNIGFMVIDWIAEELGAPNFREKFKGHTSKASRGKHDVVLLKPMTFMNLSGESVQAAMRFYKIPLENVVVIHDELDLAEGVQRLKVGGGTAGHNGLKSIVQHVGPDFVRLRYGIGRPRSGPTAGYVLSDFNADERANIGDHIEKSGKAVLATVTRGVGETMNRFNRK